jgi:hypothetical protein
MPEITDAAERASLLYLAQGDAHLRTFMPKQNPLMPDLANRILLGPGVVISDSYFITSAEIANDLGEVDNSWTRWGLRRGLIVPAFRQPDVETFKENLQGIERTKLLGIRKDADETIDKLDAAFSGDHTRSITWPDGMGIWFGKLMNEKFKSKVVDPKLWTNEHNKLWKQTLDLREKYVEMGWKRQPDPDTEGLRRASIFRALADDVGFRGDATDTNGIIASAPRSRRKALRAVILWIDELYSYNQASQFKVKSYFPVGKGDGALMMSSLVWDGSTGSASGPPDDKPQQRYDHSFQWPSDRMLRDASPDTLLGIRTDEPGQAYADSMKKFHDNPSGATWENFRSASNIYSRKICEAVRTDVESGRKVRYDKIDLGLPVGIGATAVTTDLVLLAAGLPPVVTVVSLVSSTLISASVPIRKLITQKANRKTTTLRPKGERTGQIRIDLPNSPSVHP